METFEYIDRDFNSRIVQMGQFERITSVDDIKHGDRFICPQSVEHRSGIVDGKTLYPILLFVKSVIDWHIHYNYVKDSKSTPAIAWDLCYKLVE